MRKYLDQLVNTLTAAILSACIVIVYLSFLEEDKEDRQQDALILLAERNSLSNFLNSSGYDVSNDFRFTLLISQIDKNIEKGLISEEAITEMEKTKRQLMNLYGSVKNDHLTEIQEERYKRLVLTVSYILTVEIANTLGDDITEYFFLTKLSQE